MSERYPSSTRRGALPRARPMRACRTRFREQASTQAKAMGKSRARFAAVAAALTACCRVCLLVSQRSWSRGPTFSSKAFPLLTIFTSRVFITKFVPAHPLDCLSSCPAISPGNVRCRGPPSPADDGDGRAPSSATSWHRIQQEWRERQSAYGAARYACTTSMLLASISTAVAGRHMPNLLDLRLLSITSNSAAKDLDQYRPRQNNIQPVRQQCSGSRKERLASAM
ncbi:hypothetical protein HDK90DRAFT_310759 [Phyllosticta capitalensis]|uniref:Uncharacterized protein n=1 Tax=Phyllosticta capitalensis TaxID=121624 RepID=A0ABR1YLS7_9PEZI